MSKQAASADNRSKTQLDCLEDIFLRAKCINWTFLLVFWLQRSSVVMRGGGVARDAE